MLNLTFLFPESTAADGDFKVKTGVILLTKKRVSRLYVILTFIYAILETDRTPMQMCVSASPLWTLSAVHVARNP